MVLWKIYVRFVNYQIYVKLELGRGGDPIIFLNRVILLPVLLESFSWAILQWLLTFACPANAVPLFIPKVAVLFNHVNPMVWLLTLPSGLGASCPGGSFLLTLPVFKSSRDFVQCVSGELVPRVVILLCWLVKHIVSLATALKMSPYTHGFLKACSSAKVIGCSSGQKKYFSSP